MLNLIDMDHLNRRAADVLCTLLLLTFGAAAHADQPIGFKQVDRNNNGELSIGEFVAANLSTEAFKAADRDNNQRVTASEYAQHELRVTQQQRRPSSGPHPPRG